MSNATSYEPSSLVRSFHKAPHYDAHFSPISHTFAPGDAPYQEALAQIAWPLIVVGILFILWRSVMLCCCKRKRGSLQEPKDLASWSLVLYILGIIAVCTLSFSFNSNADIDDAADALRGRTSRASKLLVEASFTAGTAGNTSAYLAGVVVSTDWSTYPSSVQAQANDLGSQLGAAAQGLLTIEGIAKTYDAAQFNDDVKDINERRSAATIAFTAFVLLLLVIIGGSVVVLNARPEITFPVQVSRLLAHVSVFVLALLAGVELALCVGAADFCYDPGSYIASQAEQPMVAGYYLLCDPTLGSPFAASFAQASAAVANSVNLIADIQQETSTAFPTIANGTAALQAQVQALEPQLSCSLVHEELIAGIDVVCGSGFENGAVTIMFVHAFVGLFFAVIAVILSLLYHNWVVDHVANPSEFTPLTGYSAESSFA